MNIIISLFILSAIVFPIALYKRSKSLKFRLIEHNNLGLKSYTPQVRIDGIWLYIVINNDFVMVDTNMGDAFLDAHDAIALIENFKSAGHFIILSNRKLNNNEKSIIIE